MEIWMLVTCIDRRGAMKKDIGDGVFVLLCFPLTVSLV